MVILLKNSFIFLPNVSLKKHSWVSANTVTVKEVVAVCRHLVVKLENDIFNLKCEFFFFYLQ